MHGKQLVENDMDTTGDWVFHHRLIQDGTFEGHSHALRKDSAGHGINVGLGYLGAIDQKGGTLAENRTDIRLGDGKDGDVLGLDVGEEGDQAILQRCRRSWIDGGMEGCASYYTRFPSRSNGEHR